MKVDVVALDHIYVTVADLAVAEAFYDPVMRLLDFRKGRAPVAGEPHRHYYNRVMAYSIRPAHTAARHDPYAPGLHHVCFRVATRRDVDTVAAALGELGIEATEPALYPQYDSDYYATFFEDPDGIRLEVVAEVARRRTIRERWDELVEFEDPLTKAGLVPG
jgi:catechol 2,3-dioxygenase-like lactoylglutathione lyase family enzyme